MFRCGIRGPGTFSRHQNRLSDGITLVSKPVINGRPPVRGKGYGPANPCQSPLSRRNQGVPGIDRSGAIGDRQPRVSCGAAPDGNSVCLAGGSQSRRVCRLASEPDTSWNHCRVRRELRDQRLVPEERVRICSRIGGNRRSCECRAGFRGFRDGGGTSHRQTPGDACAC